MTDNDKLNFLWDKWKHHDTLLYKRFDTFWKLQVAFAAVTVLLLNLFEVKNYQNLCDFFYSPGIIVLSIIIILFGFLSYSIAKMADIDRNVRNSFNEDIQTILNSIGIEIKDQDKWHFKSQESSSNKYFASNVIITIMKIYGIIASVLGIATILYKVL